MGTTEAALRDRYRGCLLALACGDALGGPVEFLDRQDIATRYPNGLRDFVGGGWLHLTPGEITDDTQMTLALARCLGPGNLDMRAVTREFLAWYDSDPKDIGITTRTALANLKSGMDWSDAGEAARRGRGSGAASNGAVMRCAPVALRYRLDRARLVQASIDSARITHADSLCTWSSVAINQAIVHLLDGGDLACVLEAAVVGIESPEVRSVVLKAADREPTAVASDGFVFDTVGAALWCLLRSESLEETLVSAVGLGGDTDTTGAVAGALAGAYYGVEAIPTRWRDAVQYGDEITQMADRLLGLAQSTPKTL